MNQKSRIFASLHPGYARCIPKLQEAKSKGNPVEWHLYSNVGHCFDCKNLDGNSKVDLRGNRVTYRYDTKATADAARRMFDFLDRVWSGRPS